MKKVLFLSNIEVPYRVRFFNRLAEECDLTVLYERSKSDNRDSRWAKSEENKYQAVYLDGLKIGRESSFSFRILSYIVKDYDAVIVGCVNTPAQMMAMLVMRLLRKKYYLSLDGEVFAEGPGLKNRIKRFFIRGAEKYFTAGEQACLSLKRIVRKGQVIPYYFSSLSEQEIAEHKERANQGSEKNSVLVIGQYYDYKGMDVAAETAKKDASIHYKFVGLGKRSEQFIEDLNTAAYPNIEVLPFLQKKELEEEYRAASLLLLPTRQECWGLVVNEAASFGTPIVSTWGSGAAVEFIGEEYSQFLAEPNNSDSLYERVKLALDSDLSAYREYLLGKSGKYSIDRSVKAFLENL